MTMLAFRRANARTMALPMPVLPPVTIATLPSSVIPALLACGIVPELGVDSAAIRPGPSSSRQGDSQPHHPTGGMTAALAGQQSGGSRRTREETTMPDAYHPLHDPGLMRGRQTAALA